MALEPLAPAAPRRVGNRDAPPRDLLQGLGFEGVRADAEDAAFGIGSEDARPDQVQPRVGRKGVAFASEPFWEGQIVRVQDGDELSACESDTLVEAASATDVGTMSDEA